jgi:hypothetical protein
MLEDLKHGTRYDGFLLLIKRVFVIRLPVVPGKKLQHSNPGEWCHRNSEPEEFQPGEMQTSGSCPAFPLLQPPVC